MDDMDLLLEIFKDDRNIILNSPSLDRIVIQNKVIKMYFRTIWAAYFKEVLNNIDKNVKMFAMFDLLE